MAEKRVSVRLVADGGRAVKAEFEGVGDAGARSAGRVSAGFATANARLTAFAAKARLVAVVAGAAVAAAGVAMVRSGLQTVDAQAKLALSLGTTVSSIQALEYAGELAGVSMGEIEQATMQLTRRLSQAATGTGPAIDGLKRLNLSAEDLARLPLDEKIIAIQDALTKFVPEAQRAAVASKLFGDRAGLIFTRIDTATLKQAAADMVAFGVSVSDADAKQIERTNDAITRLGLLWRGVSNQLAVAVAPALEAVVNGLAAVFSVTGPVGGAIKVLFDNLGRLTAYAATFAALLSGPVIAGLAAAVFSVTGLSTALVFLRAALIRTGIGALVVGAGELVYQFSRLVQGAGGFGGALSLLKDLALEVWDRIKIGASLMGESMSVNALLIKGAFAGAFASVVEKFAAMTGALADGWNTLMRSFGLESNAKGLGAELAESMREGADRMVSDAVDLAGGVAKAWGDLSAPLKSWEALRAAAVAAGEEGAEAVAGTTVETEILTDALGKAGGAAKKVKTELSGFGAAQKSLSDYAKSAMDGGKSLGDTLVSAFGNAEQAFSNFTKSGKFDFKGLIGSMLSDLATLAFKSAVLGPLADLIAGAFGGSGSKGGLGGLVSAFFNHSGGMAGVDGVRRNVPALAFLNAPRMHGGGWAGLKPDEVPTVLQRGERVLSRAEVAAGGSGSAGGISLHIDARGAQAGVAEQIDVKLRAAIPEIMRLAQRAVADGRNRGLAV